MTNKDLSQFGLTENDSAVYLFLLERGTAFAGSKMALALGLHRQYVYLSIQKLLKLELIEQVGKEPRPKFQALPPQQLARLAKKRLLDAETAARELDLISAVGADQDFEIYRGREQIISFETELVHRLQEGEMQYGIGGGSEAFIKFYAEDYEPISAVAKSKGLRTRYVGCEDEREWLEYANKIVGNFEYRILPTMPKTRVQTVMRFNSVTFYSFGTPPLVYIIKSESVYEDYKKFFEMLWELGS